MLVTTLLDRLKATNQPKDTEAETLIREATNGQPDTAYSITQAVLIQDLSLHSAQRRIADLEKTLAEAKTAAVPPPSFLAGLLGTSRPVNSAPSAGVSSAPDAATPASTGYAAQPPGSPMPGVGGMAGGGFLRGAAMTAAGVAGGALLFEGIQSLFGQHGAADILGNQGPVAGLGESVTGRDFGGGETS
jgi:hypothetical protein